MLISSFFTNSGSPQAGLTPTIRIWLLEDLADTLIITDDPMIEVGDGFYKYDFIGYDPDMDYVIRSDGGATLSDECRYLYAGNDTNANEITNKILDATATDHIGIGSVGLLINQTATDAACACTNATLALDIVNTLLKFDTNRNLIDKNAFTLTIFDDDGITPLHVFDLKDSTGSPSVEEVCERDPQ